MAVRGHFADLSEWLENVLTLGIQQGSMRVELSSKMETENFVAAVYGAMLVARAFDELDRFTSILESLIARIRI